VFLPELTQTGTTGSSDYPDPKRYFFSSHHPTYILEDRVGTGSDKIQITIDKTDPMAIVRISGNATFPGEQGDQKIWRFLQGLCERAGGLLSCSQNEDGMHRFTITVTRVI
jgi:hypothetical protein